MRKTTVKQHHRRLKDGNRTLVCKHTRTLKPVNMGRVGIPMMTKREKVRSAAEAFRERIETQKGLKGELFLEIINRGEGQYTFRVRSKKHGVLEETDYPQKKETLASLQSLAKGTPIKVEKANDYTDNVKITSPEGDVYYHQLGSNVASVNATEQIKAMKKVLKRKQEKAKAPLVDRIIAYEQGELSPKATIELFSELIKNGQAWSLQGHYGRTAMNLINNGYLDKKGKILKTPLNIRFKYTDDFGRPVYEDIDNKRSIVFVDDVPHTMTKSGEPDMPIKV